jgi:tetratricopeptide (TPR) repeat protein
MRSARLRRLPWPLIGLGLLGASVAWALSYLFLAADRGVAATLIQTVAAVLVPAAGVGGWLWQRRHRGSGAGDPESTAASDDPPTDEPRGGDARPAIFRPPRAERNVNFTGRQELLDAVEGVLRPGVPAALLQAITGLGGVGKTELVIEYAYRRRDRYDVVWSLRAETAATLLGDMQGLASRLGLSQAAEGVTQRVAQWLERRDRWLLIFDNATALSELRPYLPGGAGHILITSREQVWRQAAAVIDVDAWRPEESAAFLRRRIGPVPADDEPAMAAIAQILGHLPLALEQAAAFMEETGTTCRAYVRLLSEHRDEVLGERAPANLDYNQTVATTWDVTLGKILLERPASVVLLQLCAFLAPEDIPETLFRGAGTALPAALREAGASRLAFEETLGLLDRYSLVRRNDGRFSVHRLVQHVVRAALSDPEKRERIQACLRLLDRSFPEPPGQPEPGAPTRTTASPHALALAPYGVGVDPEAAQELLLRVGDHMVEQAQTEGAQGSLEQAHQIAARMYGHDNPDVARILLVLGRVLRTRTNLTAARATFERALAILEPIYGADHPDVVNLCYELAQTLIDIGDPSGAVEYLDRASRSDGGSRAH